MFKDIQYKFILIFLLVGILIITGFSGVFILSINNITSQIQTNSVTEMGQVIELLNQMKANTKITSAILIAVFSVVAILVSAFLSKFVIYPINRLIKSAEKITEDESKGFKNRSKKKGEVGNLENVFGVMTTELKEKLSEVSTQKNQIETILLHMTDGIIAFNMQGEIILINPVAKKFLSISPEDNTFDDIFKKFNLDINMEKVIYLESWTSTEERIQVEDRFVKVLFAPFKDEKDRPDGVIAVIQDIRQKRLAKRKQSNPYITMALIMLL